MDIQSSLRSCTSWLAAILFALLFVVDLAVADSQTAPSRIFIFGDSLSDPGNVWWTTGDVSMQPYDPIPESPYAIGGHHFSNGKTWIEQLAQRLDLDTSGKSAVQRPGHFGNYAFGGARARPSDHPAPSAAEQIGLFLNDFQGIAPSDALYVLQFGGNDVRNGLEDPANAGAIAIQAAASIVGAVGELYGRGARNFLVVNAPNLGRVPAVAALGPAAVDGATQLSAFYNFVLELGYPDFQVPGISDLETLPDISIDRLDLFGFINEVVTNPGDYEITDPFFPCLLFNVASGAKCDNADERLFWDGIHPTRKGHSVLADFAEASLLGS